MFGFSAVGSARIHGAVIRRLPSFFVLFFLYFVVPASDQFTQFLTRFGFYGTDSLISRCLPNRTAGRSVLFRRRGQRMAARPQ